MKTDKYYVSLWFFPLLALITVGACALIMKPWKNHTHHAKELQR